MPPKHVKREVEAVAAAALFMMLLAAAAVYGQEAGVSAEKILEAPKSWVQQAVAGVRLALAIALWGAIVIMAYHMILAKLAPTRFQRLGGMWDALERAKDVVISMAWLFLLIYGIYAAIGVLTQGGKVDAETVVKVLRWMLIEPFQELIKI